MNNFYPGVDIVDVDRIKSSIEKYQDKFLSKVFSKEEQDYCNSKSNPFIHFSGKFAAKEAVMKSLGKGWRQLSWKDIEISGGGKPEVILYGKAKNLAKELNIENVHVSLSHEEDKAIAFIISEIEE